MNLNIKITGAAGVGINSTVDIISSLLVFNSESLEKAIPSLKSGATVIINKKNTKSFC